MPQTASIDLEFNEEQFRKNAAHCRHRGTVLPTFAQMKEPGRIPEEVAADLKEIGLWDVHPRNLFRITWKNEPPGGAEGRGEGGFDGVNHIELPSELTGVKARIIGLAGKWFPTGAHKVGASYGCLAPRLVTGQFDPASQKAVWPSTGNYCRGGAYVSALLGCESVAILPEEMSRERFDWLKTVAGEVIATPGCESNVKEIFDKCWELKAARDDLMIFNQFEEFGNVLWHYEVTGSAMEEVFEKDPAEEKRLAGIVLSSGSAGTLGSGYYLKEKYPRAKLAVAEALQCPTLLYNGYGGHRIEGIGDKHVPWIHDLKNTDMVIGVDDEQTIRLLRLFNEPEGRELLAGQGVDEKLIARLDLLGISGIGNLIAAIKFAKYYELTEKDVVFTVFTDSLELYGSRLSELTHERGAYQESNGWQDVELIDGLDTADILELRYPDRKRIHNLKYFTWIEQQGRGVGELNAQWYNHDAYWGEILGLGPRIDALIEAFNGEVVKG